MKIVIDIDDMAYKFVQDTSFVEDESTMFEQTNVDRKKTLFLFDILDAIKNGTPLPKGHGDLKDSNNLKHAFISWSMAVHGNFTDADIASIIYNSPTILEADKNKEANDDAGSN